VIQGIAKIKKLESKDAMVDHDDPEGGAFNPASLAWRAVDVRGDRYVQPVFLAIDNTDMVVGLNNIAHYPAVFGKQGKAASKRFPANFKRDEKDGIAAHLNDYRLHAQFFGNEKTLDYTTSCLPVNAEQLAREKKTVADAAAAKRKKAAIENGRDVADENDDEEEEEEEEEESKAKKQKKKKKTPAPAAPAATAAASSSSAASSGIPSDKIEHLFNQTLQMHTLSTALLASLAGFKPQLRQRLP